MTSAHINVICVTYPEVDMPDDNVILVQNLKMIEGHQLLTRIGRDNFLKSQANWA